MMGLIWFVQVVHYPLFLYVGESQYPVYQKVHMQRTTWVVGPVMLVELLTSVWLIWQHWMVTGLWIGLGLLGIIWLSTGLLQVPRHNRLLLGFDLSHHRLLVVTNWVRTCAWTGRGIVMIWLLSIW